MIIEKKFLKNIDFFLYKKKHLILYIVIGFLSLIFETLIRNFLSTKLGFDYPYTHFSLVAGIIFAFYFNIKFNFNIQKIYFKRSLFYFTLISLGSYMFQLFIKKSVNLGEISFTQERFLISGIFFIAAYFLHINFSFKDNRKVGVAIYANGYEDVNNIFNKISYYPDFIHVDIIDKSMNKNALDAKLSKLEVVKAYWPDHKINTHIMSNHPLQILDDNILSFSDVIYVHNEIEDSQKVIVDLIKKHKKIPGIVLHSINNYENLSKIIGNFKEILVLSIIKPGESGQTFNKRSFELIERINKLENRNKINLCVDGGLKSNLINKFLSDKIVSGSDVLNSLEPKRQIMKLQTLSRYEK